MLVTANAANLKVDHATIAGLDLRAMEEELAAAGLPSEYGGKHPNRTTEMAIVSFLDGSYLELISKQRDADAAAFRAHPWAKFIESNAGPCAWAVRPGVLGAEVSRLRAAGVAVDDAVRSGRTRPDGVRLEWETAQFHGERGAFFPFMIRDLTPHENRVYPSGKPSVPQFGGISKVIIAVRDLDTAIGKYQKVYGLNPPLLRTDATLGAKLASFDGTPVVLASPSSPDNWIAERISKYGDAPCAFVIRAPRPGRTKWIRLKTAGGRIGIE